MRPLRTFFLLLSLLAGRCAAGQPPAAGLAWGDPQDTLPSHLFEKYPPRPDSAEAKIRQLLARSKANFKKNAYIEALNDLQRALALEAYAPPNTPAVFELNIGMGYHAATLNPRYALLFSKKAFDIGGAIAELNPGARFQLAGTIAGLYTKLAEPDSALYWHQQALSEAYARHGAIAQASALNNLGVFYSTLGQRDSATTYLQAALRTLNASPRFDTILLCGIQDNIAQERERAGDYAAALRTYHSNDTVFTRKKKWGRILPNRLRALQVRRKMRDSDLDNDIENLSIFIERHRKKLPDEDVLKCWEFAQDYFLEMGELRSARRYNRLCVAERDSLERKNKEKTDLIINAFLTVQAARFRRDLEVQHLEAAAARQSLRSTRQMTLLAVLAGIAAIGLLALFRRRRRREQELAHRLTVAELRAKELEAQAMAQTLEMQKRDITTVALHNTQVLDNSRRMIGRLTEIARKKENAEQDIHALVQELQTQEQLSERAQVVQENIDKVNAEFYQALKTRFPALSKAEVELCGYLHLSLSNKDIALLKNIAPASVKMGKNRLRKKLGLMPEADLSGFIQEIGRL